MGCNFLLQGIFLTQESNPGLLPCRQIPYRLSYEGSLGLGRSPRKWQPSPVFLPGEFPRTEEPGGLQSMGSIRAGHSRATEHIRVLYQKASACLHVSACLHICSRLTLLPRPSLPTSFSSDGSLSVHLFLCLSLSQLGKMLLNWECRSR